MQTSAEETLITFIVPDGKHSPTRIDAYLAGFLQNVTRSKAQRGIKEGRVEVNGKPCIKSSYIVQPGDEILCRLPKPPPIEALPEDIPLKIYYEDDWIIILEKPAGMVVHPAYGNRTGTLINALLHHVGVASYEALVENKKGLSTVGSSPRFPNDPTIRPGLIHRLDKDTSGIMVVAKDDATHASIAKQFATRTITRSYQSILWGIPEPDSGWIEGNIGRDKKDRKKMAVVKETEGKYARTEYEVLERALYCSLVSFRLKTGRTHQIRVHASHIGHPVVGDTTYGGNTLVYGPHTSSRRKFFDNLFSTLPRQALHACELGFIHPVTKEEVYFESPLPEDMKFVWKEICRIERF